jgi:hypothetical protein
MTIMVEDVILAVMFTAFLVVCLAFCKATRQDGETEIKEIKNERKTT